MAGPRPVSGAGARGGETARVQASELPALDELIARRDLVEHARRRVARAQEVETEVTQPRVGARLRDDRAHPGRHVNAARADRHLVGRDRDAEHAGALTPADERERRELDANHGGVSLNHRGVSLEAYYRRTMTDIAEVVIVGAGIMGVSTAYHLARLGVRRVIVLERDTVCSGSTALASGGIRH